MIATWELLIATDVFLTIFFVSQVGETVLLGVSDLLSGCHLHTEFQTLRGSIGLVNLSLQPLTK